MSAPRVPALTPPVKPKKLTVQRRTTANGVDAMAVRRPGVPMAELRLRVPFLAGGTTHPARALVLSDTMLTGTAQHDRAALAIAVQSLGADVSVSVDADRLLISANVLASALPRLLDLLAVVLTEASYPDDEVSIERERLVERVTIARSRAGTIAAERLAMRMWGDHPYALDLPQADGIAAVSATQARALHRDRVRPDGATLVVVGDVSPARVLDQVERALDPWTGTPKGARVPKLPTPWPGPLLIVDRPGSVQSSLRMGASALPRSDGGYPALQLANLIFGGYFSSRWTANLREDKGYTYGPHSRVDHHQLGSTLMFDVEVASEVTAPALLETLYELGRIASLPVTDGEVDAVRQYAIGNLAMSTATQAGLASTLSALAALGLGPEWLVSHAARLAETTLDDVSAAAAEFFAPARLTSVIVGDAAAIAGPLAALGPIET
jgi:predicted Zn-dependent peptidase